MMTSDDLYTAGYAIPAFNISEEYDIWRFKEEYYKTSKEVTRHYRKGLDFGIAKIEDVRRQEIK